MFHIPPAPKVPAGVQPPTGYTQRLDELFPPLAFSTTALGLSSLAVAPTALAAPIDATATAGGAGPSTALALVPQQGGGALVQSTASRADAAPRPVGAGSTATTLSSAATALVVLNEAALAASRESDRDALLSYSSGTATKVGPAAASVTDFNAAFAEQQRQQRAQRAQREQRVQQHAAERRQREEEEAALFGGPTTTAAASPPPVVADQFGVAAAGAPMPAVTPAATAVAAGVATTETATFEMLAPRDHMGRTFLHPPPQLQVLAEQRQRAAAATGDAMDTKAAPGLPAKLSLALRNVPVGAAAGTKPVGLQVLRWAPPYAHLAFAGDLHGAVTAWRVAGSDGRLDTRPGGQQRAAVYRGHNAPVREIVFPAAEFNVGIGANAAVFASAAADSESPLVLWDTETGQPLQRLALDPSVFVGASGVRARAAGCTALTFIPAGTHAASGRGDTLLLAGMGRHLVLFDARSGRRVMDLDGHNERVQHVAVVQGGRAVMSCAQDRTVRLWDVRSPVSLQEFADASMEAVAHVAEHPTLDDVCLQSNDNRVRVLLPAQARAGRGAAGSMPSTAFQYRMAKETAFGGHSVSGTGCRLDFSRTDNGRVLSSGDIHGTLTLWDYGQGVRATRGGGDEHAEVRKPLKAMRVHAEALTAHLWHPLFPSTILTASQDGTLKLFT